MTVELSRRSLDCADSSHNRVPGDLLLHPVALIALGLVILNDRFLKVHYPSAITGKLSDFAGLVYFPLFVVSVLEGFRWLARRRPWELGPRAITIVSMFLGVIMTLIKTWGPAAEFYRSYLGVVLWPAYVVGDVVQGRGLPGVRRVGLIEDATDLVALVALLLPVWVGTRVRLARSRSMVRSQAEMVDLAPSDLQPS
ncbi:MAG TPA: hypothetical protein VL068_10275 [Microthrixaceae bacterium]|nr:hypothetical protein [Microthrixaceae bacterium]